MWCNDLKAYEDLLRENRETNEKIINSFDELSSKIRGYTEKEDEWPPAWHVYLSVPLVIASVALNILFLWALIKGW